MASFLPDTDSEDELPIGWEERATIDGQVYYANHQLKSTQWTHPKTGKRKKLAGDLPPDWEETVNDEGNLIYVNKETNKTTYTDPRLAFAVEHNKDENDLRSKFDSSATALQILHGRNLSNKIVIVTGGNCGIGYETARALTLHGAHVIMACRDLEKANNVITKIRKERANAKLSSMKCDLSSLASVKQFAEEFISLNLPLHILILNAGVFGLPQSFTEDNIETTFQVNHLSHFYLAQLLRDRLIESKPSRIVVVSSESHRFSSLNSTNLKEIRFTQPNSFFVPMMAYNDSKLCNLLFVYQYNLMYRNYGININAVHPGNLICSNLSRNWWFYRLLFSFVRPFTKSLQQGAATSVYCATSQELDNVIGCYFNNCTLCEPSKAARDEELALILWKLSEKLIKDREQSL